MACLIRRVYYKIAISKYDSGKCSFKSHRSTQNKVKWQPRSLYIVYSFLNYEPRKLKSALSKFKMTLMAMGTMGNGYKNNHKFFRDRLAYRSRKFHFRELV
uniref:Uncharacterized protein n=1 Tax=Cacopsylla melanoneura TaxID=428564 RepID=A0A8D8US45_9HEMI